MFALKATERKHTLEDWNYLDRSSRLYQNKGCPPHKNNGDRVTPERREKVEKQLLIPDLSRNGISPLEPKHLAQGDKPTATRPDTEVLKNLDLSIGYFINSECLNTRLYLGYIR